ncbi:MAG: DUF350 domain-containing protein [Mariprofundaceae bacterium]|nr:DUF350 domain-containing protein [Mariprofundaceae bacterium]
MEILNLMNLDAHYIQILLIDLTTAIVLLFIARQLLGLTYKVSTRVALAKDDNPAYGISLAGIILAITIILTGVLFGNASYSFLDEFANIAIYGSLGVFLMLFASFVFDKVSMPRISIPEAIQQGNIAAGLINAGNLIATAIIIRAVMIWSGLEGLFGMVATVAGFILSQLILTVVSKYRIKLFNAKNETTFQAAINGGNLAIAWRFTGFRIAVALAITAASGLVPPYSGNILTPILLWLLVSLAMLGLISMLNIITDKVILGGIDLRDEVDSQQNVAIGVTQAAISISIGLVVAALMN